MRWKEVCNTCNIGCKEVEKLLDDKSVKQIECPEWKGLLIFRELPPEYRPAGRNDMIYNGMVVKGVKCLLKSFHSNNIQSYKTHETTDVMWINEFIVNGQCFVRK